MTEIHEEAGVDIGATLAKTVIVPVGGALEYFESFVCPCSDLPALAAFLASRPRCAWRPRARARTDSAPS